MRVDRGSGSRAGQLLRHKDDPKRWLVKVYLGRDANGKKKYYPEVVPGSKRDAEARLTELLQSKNQGRLAPRSRATLADLVDEWLQHKAHEVSARTLSSYSANLKLYVLPTLGSQRLSTLTLRQIEALYADMRNGNLPTPPDAIGWQGKPLSARTVQMTHTALNQALRQAVRWGMIPYNPAQEASARGGTPKAKRTLSAAEREAFLAASGDSFHRVLYRVLMDTGMRPGEACALTWRDVDFQASRITIERAVTRGEDGKAIIAPPKTRKSRRTIPMFGLDDELLRHYQWQAEHSLDATGHVFTNQEGGILKPWSFNKRDLARVAAAAGIDGSFTLYSFRHTFATLHLASLTPTKVVSDWLGHASIQQTADTYQHLSGDVSADYADRFVAWLAAEAEGRADAKPN